MPFISLATDFTLIDTNEYYRFFYEFFGFETKTNFIVFFGIVLIFFYIFRSIINLLYVYSVTKFTQDRYHILSFHLFKNYTGIPYKEFVKKNSSELTKTIVSEARNLSLLVSAVLFMVSEIFVLLLVYILMLYVNLKVTLILTVILFFNALLMLKTISKKIKRIGIKRAEIQKKFFELINKSLANLKLIKLNSNENNITNEFDKYCEEYARVNIYNNTLQHVPKLFLEALGFSVIVFIITYIIYKEGSDIVNYLPVVTMFVLALYRLLPSVNRIMTSFNQILFLHKSLDIVHDDFMYEVEKLGDQDLAFTNSIQLSNIVFEYDNHTPILNDISLTINKGDKIAFVGESGSGKSTLVDLIMGLYKPKSGSIKIDNTYLNDENIKSWRKKIGYIPQSVYLFDGTVGENLAFDKNIDEKKAIEVLKQANIYDFISKNNGLNTKVGEGGIMLSGGQKQRIAIARALYNDPDILVLDEATSALDSETEAKIMDEIYNVSKNKTLIVIAHRISTINRCNYKYVINNGSLLEYEKCN